jgi:hypothetical protein
MIGNGTNPPLMLPASVEPAITPRKYIGKRGMEIVSHTSGGTHVPVTPSVRGTLLASVKSLLVAVPVTEVSVTVRCRDMVV